MDTLFNLKETSYWLLIIWTIAGGIILNMMPRTTLMVCGHIRERWHIFSAMLLVIPFILWTGYRPRTGDTGSYIKTFLAASSSLQAVPRILFSGEKDTLFYASMTLLESFGINDYRHYFLFLATLQMLCMVSTFRKYSYHFWFSIFLFIASTDYISWMHNGIRQFTAVCITFAAFDLMVRKKYIRYALVVLVAMQVHASAAIMLPLAFIMNGKALNRKTMLTILGAALCIPFIDQFTPILETLMADTQYGDVVSNEIWSTDDGTNALRVLVYSVPGLIALVGRRYVSATEDPAINMCINASIITMAIYLVSMVTSGIYVGRLPIYTTFYGYMMLPWMIDRMFEKASVRVILFLAIVCYLGFFYVQMSMNWGLL